MDLMTGLQGLGGLARGLVAGRFVTVCKVMPVGSLQVRKQANGTVAFYWRYSMGAASERVLVGDYDASAPPKSLTRSTLGFSAPAALQEAQRLASQHKAHLKDGGRPALLAQAALARAAAVQAQAVRQRFTLEALLMAYCGHLEAIGRKAHRDARGIFMLHVVQAWPELAARPAQQLSPEQVADMMRRLIDLGKGRTANKLRSYLRAAYQMAKSARLKASVPVVFKGFDVHNNPAADTEPDGQSNRSAKLPLSLEELQHYWRAIQPLDGFRGALLRLHLLTGGQRIEQLVNLRTSDAGHDSITLLDGKGRPGREPRPHAVPLTDAATVALMECGPSGAYALSTDGGSTHVAATTLSQWAAEAVPGLAGFQAKRIRSGVETLLARCGVSPDHRGRLQSHGVTGVQARHYDGHDYRAEKLAALDLLWRELQGQVAGNVVSLRRA